MNWCLVLSLTRLWWVNLFWKMRTPWIQFLQIRCWRRRFMNKLMILSTSFVSLMSSTIFFFLRLDRFTQLLKTFSVVLGLEFVFSNLCLTVSENLLSLSLQESPNLFAFRVVSLSFLGARHKWANNGSPRSIMTNRRRQTGRQAFFFRVIGSSSARVKERLADGDVIVVEVIREPLLAQGLLGVFDISLCDEMVVGLITCGRLVLGQGANVLSGCTQGIYPRHHGSWRCRAVGTAGWSERWWGKRSRRETANRTRWQMRVQCEMRVNLSFCQLWAKQCAYIWTRKNSQGTMTPTTRTRETTKTNKLSCGSIHSFHESSVDVLVGFLMLRSNSLVVNGPNLFTFMDLWGVIFTGSARHCNFDFSNNPWPSL